MLVLSRHKNESLVIGGDIVVHIVEVRGDKVRLGIDAPADVKIHREEIFKLVADQTVEIDVPTRKAA